MNLGSRNNHLYEVERCFPGIPLMNLYAFNTNIIIWVAKVRIVRTFFCKTDIPFAFPHHLRKAAVINHI